MSSSQTAADQQEVALDDAPRPVAGEAVSSRVASGRRRGLRRRSLIASDLTALALAFLLAQAIIGSPTAGTDRFDFPLELLWFVLTLPGWIVVAKTYGLYDRDEQRLNHSTTDEIVTIFHLVTVGVWFLYIILQFANVSEPYFPKVAAFWLLAIVLLVLGRTIARALAGRTIPYRRNTVVVGSGVVAQRIARVLVAHPEWGRRVVGFVDDTPFDRSPDIEHVPMLGSLDELPELVNSLNVESVVIAFSRDDHVRTLDKVFSLRAAGVHVDIVPRFFETIAPGVDLHAVQGLPLLGLPPIRRRSRARAVVDVVSSAVGLVLLAPLFLVIGIAVKIDSRGPVFYRSERIGQNGRIFRALKFRTMAEEYCRGEGYGGERAELEFDNLMSDDAAREEFRRTHKLRDDPRVTRVGRWLRRSSLDELPQLVNVLRLEMTLVGPRPITVHEYAALTTGDAREVRVPWTGVIGYWELEDVRPGLTGLWQVSGRSDLEYDERVRLDKLYAATVSLKSDFVIFAKTIQALVSRSGAS